MSHYRSRFPASSAVLSEIEQQQQDIELEIAQLNQQLTIMPTQRKSPKSAMKSESKLSQNKNSSFSSPKVSHSSSPPLNSSAPLNFVDTATGAIDLHSIYRAQNLSVDNRQRAKSVHQPVSETRKQVKLGDLSGLTNIEGVSNKTPQSTSSNKQHSPMQKSTATSPNSAAKNASAILTRTNNQLTAASYHPPAFAHVQEAALIRHQLQIIKERKELEWKKKLEDRRLNKLKELHQQIEILDRNSQESREKQEKLLENELNSMDNNGKIISQITNDYSSQPQQQPQPIAASLPNRIRSVTFHSPERSSVPVILKRGEREPSAELIEAELRKINESLVNLNLLEAQTVQPVKISSPDAAATQTPAAEPVRPRSLHHSDSAGTIAYTSLLPTPPTTPGFDVHYVLSPAAGRASQNSQSRGRDKTQRNALTTPTVNRNTRIQIAAIPLNKTNEIQTNSNSTVLASTAESAADKQQQPNDSTSTPLDNSGSLTHSSQPVDSSLISSVSRSLSIRSKTPPVSRDVLAHRSAMKRISSMIRKSENAQEKLRAATEVSGKIEMKECTFNPALSPQTKEITRLQAQKKLKRLLEQQELLRIRQEELIGRAFQPAADALKKNNNKSSSSASSSVFSSSAGKPKTPKSLLLQDRIDNLYHSHSSTQSKLNEKREIKKVQEEKLFQQTHTFQPNTNNINNHNNHNNSNSGNIEQLFHSKVLSSKKGKLSPNRYSSVESSSYADMFEAEIAAESAPVESAAKKFPSPSQSKSIKPAIRQFSPASNDFIAAQQAELDQIQRALQEVQILHPFNDESRAKISEEIKKSAAEQWKFEENQNESEEEEEEKSEAENKIESERQAQAEAAKSVNPPQMMFPPHPFYPPPHMNPQFFPPPHQFWPNSNMPYFPYPTPFPYQNHQHNSPQMPPNQFPPPPQFGFPPYFHPAMQQMNPIQMQQFPPVQVQMLNPNQNAPQQTVDAPVVAQASEPVQTPIATVNEPMQISSVTSTPRFNSVNPLSSSNSVSVTPRASLFAAENPVSIPSTSSDSISIAFAPQEFFRTEELDYDPIDLSSEKVVSSAAASAAAAELVEERKKKLAKLKAKKFLKSPIKSPTTAPNDFNGESNQESPFESPRMSPIEMPEEKSVIQPQPAAAPAAAVVPSASSHPLVSDRLLVHVDIQLSATESDRISVRSNDNPADLARDFIVRHRLKAELQSVIQNLLEKQIQAVQAKN